MVLSSFYKGDDTHDAQSVQDTKGEAIWVVPGLDCNRVGDIDDDSYCDCFEHLSILSLCVFFIVCSRNVEGAGSGSRTRRDGAYLSVLRLRWWRALRRSLRSVQPPGCSQGTPIPSLYLSSVSMGVVLLAPG